MRSETNLPKYTWTPTWLTQLCWTLFRALTWNLDSDGEYFNNSIKKLNQWHLQMETLLKNQTSVTTSLIKNFNETIEKLQIDEKTLNKNIKNI